MNKLGIYGQKEIPFKNQLTILLQRYSIDQINTYWPLTIHNQILSILRCCKKDMSWEDWFARRFGITMLLNICLKYWLYLRYQYLTKILIWFYLYFKTMVSFQMSSGNFKLAPFRYVFFFLSCQLQLHVHPRIRSAGH